MPHACNVHEENKAHFQAEVQLRVLLMSVGSGGNCSCLG